MHFIISLQMRTLKLILQVSEVTQMKNVGLSFRVLFEGLQSSFFPYCSVLFCLILGLYLFSVLK